MKVFYIDPANIDSLYGSGGIPIFKNALRFHSNHFYFIGCSLTYKINTWHTIEIFGNTITYFPTQNILRNLLPRNLLFAIYVFLHWRKINQIDKECKTIFTRTYSIVWLFSFFIKGYNVVFYAPGLGNPLEIGRFPLLSIFSGLYNLIHYRALSKSYSLLAAASIEEVNGINKNLMNIKSEVLFIQVPESVDTNDFKPLEKSIALNNLNLTFITKNTDVIFSFIGRLAKVKGIPLIIDAFGYYQNINPDSYLLIAGEGEYKAKIMDHIKSSNLNRKVILLGKLNSSQIVSLINYSDACLFGSYVEGFSIAMLEILSCGKPIVSTKVSGTDELLIPNETGIIIDNRDPKKYCEGMIQVLKIENSNYYSRNLVLNHYSVERQWETILKSFK